MSYKQSRTITITDERFGNTEPIMLSAVRYADPANIALLGTCSETGEPWCTYTVNFDEDLPPACVAIKCWSENLGVEQILIDAGIIDKNPIDYIESGFVVAPVYHLTAKAIDAFRITDKAH